VNLDLCKFIEKFCFEEEILELEKTPHLQILSVLKLSEGTLRQYPDDKSW
jgi:hypothetical protein